MYHKKGVYHTPTTDETIKNAERQVDRWVRCAISNACCYTPKIEQEILDSIPLPSSSTEIVIPIADGELTEAEIEDGDYLEPSASDIARTEKEMRSFLSEK